MSEILPEHILKNLKQYERHIDNFTCLECGYKGMVGIKSVNNRYIYTTFIAFCLTIAFAGFGLSGLFLSPIIFGAIFGVFIKLSANHIVVCPNCNKDLHPR